MMNMAVEIAAQSEPQRFPSQPQTETPCKTHPSRNLYLWKYIKLLHYEVNKGPHRKIPPKPRVMQTLKVGGYFHSHPCCLHSHGLSDLCLLLRSIFLTWTFLFTVLQNPCFLSHQFLSFSLWMILASSCFICVISVYSVSPQCSYLFSVT